MHAFSSDMLLIDGTPIAFRRVRPTDTTRLSDAFGKLSPRSRYMRFLAPVGSLTDAQLRAFTNIDFVDHVAIAAERIDDPERPFIGVGRWVRSRDEPHVAEVAVTVIDAYQRRGVGAALLQRLAEIAEQRDVHWFVATVLGENFAVRQALKRLGARQTDYDMGAYTFRVPIAACMRQQLPQAG